MKCQDGFWRFLLLLYPLSKLFVQHLRQYQTFEGSEIFLLHQPQDWHFYNCSIFCYNRNISCVQSDFSWKYRKNTIFLYRQGNRNSCHFVTCHRCSNISPKFVQIWLILTTIAWLLKPMIMVVFIIWLDNQPQIKRTHFQDTTITGEIITLAVVTVFNFVITPYFLVVAKSYRSKLIKENDRDYGQHI